MAKLVELLFKDFAATRVIGKSIVVQMEAENPVPAYWETCMNEGVFQTLEALGPSNDAYVGWMGEWNAETKMFTLLRACCSRGGRRFRRGMIIAIWRPV